MCPNALNVAHNVNYVSFLRKFRRDASCERAIKRLFDPTGCTASLHFHQEQAPRVVTALDPDRVCTSTRSQAQEAAALLGHAGAEPISALRQQALGDWEGRKIRWIQHETWLSADRAVCKLTVPRLPLRSRVQRRDLPPLPHGLAFRAAGRIRADRAGCPDFRSAPFPRRQNQTPARGPRRAPAPRSAASCGGPPLNWRAHRRE